MAIEQAKDAEVWEYDPDHSVISFQNQYLGIVWIHCRFTEATVTGHYDEADPSSCWVEATIHTASLTSDLPRRDDVLKGPQYMDVEKYPTITFRSTRVEQQAGRWQMVGDLTICEVTREVTLDTVFNGQAIDREGVVRHGFSARTTIGLSEFGVHAGAARSSVGEETPISLEVSLVKQGSGTNQE